jgi:hypothetical protein
LHAAKAWDSAANRDDVDDNPGADADEKMAVTMEACATPAITAVSLGAANAGYSSVPSLRRR